MRLEFTLDSAHPEYYILYSPRRNSATGASSLPLDLA